MRVPMSHPIVLTAALCLTAAAPNQIGQASAWGEASVSEKLRIIRHIIGSHEVAPMNERPILAQNWRNCISGYWRNC
jgi:hypothetical protein